MGHGYCRNATAYNTNVSATQDNTADDSQQPTVLHLQADGFTLTMSVRASPAQSYRERFFTGTATLQPALAGPLQPLHTKVIGLISDLECLCTWVEQHIQALIVRPQAQSTPWVPAYLDMSVYCLQGYIDTSQREPSGYFTIRVMLWAGRDRHGTAVYAGLEGVVNVQQALAFCTAIRAYLAPYKDI